MIENQLNTSEDKNLRTEFACISVKKESTGYLLELEGGVLNGKSERFFCLKSLSGVSSTTRLATRIASSSQPAIAATDLNPGLNMLSIFSPLSDASGSFGGDFSGFCSFVNMFGASWISGYSERESFGLSIKTNSPSQFT